MKKVMIRGYYGVCNLGDDMILNAVVNTCVKAECKAIYVVGGGTAAVDSICVDKKRTEIEQVCIPNGIFNKFKFFKEIDCYIHGGGGLFPNEDPKGLLFLLVLFIIARIAGTRIVFYGIEINPIKRTLSKFIWNRLVSLTDMTVARNKQTYQLLIDCGCQKKKVLCSSDVTFSLLEEGDITEFKTEKKIMLWCPNNLFRPNEMKREDIRKRYQLICSQLANVCDAYTEYHHVFLPFHPKFDIPYINDIVSNIKKADYEILDVTNMTAIEKRSVFKKADFCMCMRFHSVVFSLFCKKPFFAISYSPKTSELLNELGLNKQYVEYGIREENFFFKAFDLNYNEFKNKLNNSVENVSEQKNILPEITKGLIKQALEAEKCLIDWLKE